ncbi:MAG: hypothetical protein JW757_09530 [Anaerolineales bacterium]|nr:hypothetical protein [Anaerolineales bacterium]
MKTRIIFLIFAALLMLAGCGKSSEVDVSATQTFQAALESALAATLQAESTAQQKPSPEVIEPSLTAETAPEVFPTFTPLPTVPASAPTQELPTVNPTDLPIPCYRAEMISETIPDGTIFRPGEIFTKIWVIRNTGVCEWTEKFTWTLVEGEDFGVPTELTLNRTVLPGEDLEVKLEMQTPLLEGGYKGTYQILTNEGGSVTPLGFWVYIVSQN